MARASSQSSSGDSSVSDVSKSKLDMAVPCTILTRHTQESCKYKRTLYHTCRPFTTQSDPLPHCEANNHRTLAPTTSFSSIFSLIKTLRFKTLRRNFLSANGYLHNIQLERPVSSHTHLLVGVIVDHYLVEHVRRTLQEAWLQQALEEELQKGTHF